MEKSTTFEESNLNTSTNTSTLKINIYFSAQNQTTYFYGKTLYCTCEGVTKSEQVSHSKGGYVSVSFTFDNIQHNNDGTKSVNWSWSCATGTTVLGTIGDNGTKQLTRIDRYAITNSVTGTDNFDIEKSFKINYTKYVNDYKYKLRISVPQIILLERIDYNTSNTAFSLSQETIQRIFNNNPSPYPAPNNNLGTDKSNTIRLGFAVETYDSTGTTKLSDGNEVIITGRITDADPTFENFDFQDINSTTLALTGDNSVNINGYSKVFVEVKRIDRATPNKGATMSKYRLVIGEQYTDFAYNQDPAIDPSGTGWLENASSGTYKVQAIDSRGNSTTVTKYATQEIAYTPISFEPLQCKVERKNGGVSGTAKLTFNGNIWNDDFGQVVNSVKSASYEYRETGSNQWITPADFAQAGVTPTDITPTLTNNTFNFSDDIKSIDSQNNYEFELNKSYEFRITITDELSTKTIDNIIMVSAIPNISLSDNGVGIMCDFDDNLGGYLQVGGERLDSLNDVVAYSNPSGSSAISFTAPFSGIIDLTAVWSGWGYDGGNIKVEIFCTQGSATALQRLSSSTSGHNTSAVPVIAKAYYYVVKGTTYAFDVGIDGRQGGNLSYSMIAILRKGQSI